MLLCTDSFFIMGDYDMAKAILKFTLPEEHEEHGAAVHGMDFYLCLYDLDQWLRNEEKYKDIDTIRIGEVRDKVREIMSDRTVSLDMFS